MIHRSAQGGCLVRETNPALFASHPYAATDLPFLRSRTVCVLFLLSRDSRGDAPSTRRSLAACGESQPAQNQTPASPAPSAGEEAEDHARASFDVFTRKWMQKLAKTEDFQKKRMQITQTQQGFVAEYTGYLPYRYTRIKLTQSKATPFIGILTYYKKTMRSVGETKKQALNGLFEQAGTSQVSEIFRYTKGEWVY